MEEYSDELREEPDMGEWSTHDDIIGEVLELKRWSASDRCRSIPMSLEMRHMKILAVLWWMCVGLR